MSQVSYGTITITDTTDIERIYTVYAKSVDNITVPSIAKESWSENVSTAPGTGNYIWQRTVVEKSGTGDKTYSDPVCLTGEEGIDATEISGIEVRYGISADWNTQPTSWSADTPAYDSSKPKYWTRTRLIYDTNPATYSNPVYTKDEALTKAVSDSAIANSIAQHASEDAQGAMSQSANGIAEIYRVWYRTNTTAVPSKPPTHVTSVADDVNNTWTTVKPKENSDNRYYFYCEETVTNGGVSSWTNPVLDISNLSQYEIDILTAKVKNYWWDSNGAHIASGINGADVDENSDVSKYGFNSLVGLSGISFGYNAAKVIDLNTTPSPTSLKFYQPPAISGSTVSQGALSMELSSNALKFYGSSTSTADATLNSTGLKLTKGGIVVVPTNSSIGSNNSIYISSDNLGSKVASLVNDDTKTNWRAVIGSKFGVDSEGNLYANNATISGTMTIGANSTINGTNASTVVNNASTGAGAAADLATYKTTVSNTYATQEALSDVEEQIPDVSGLASKSAAIAEEQLIYIQATSGTNSVSAYPSSSTTTSSYWVTQTGESIPNGTPPDGVIGQTPRWTIKRPSYQKNYPVIFVAKQKKTVSGEITCSTPIKDDTITIIDGGHITTGTIDASRLSVYDATINKISASAIDVSSIQIGQSQVNNLTTDLGNKASVSAEYSVDIVTSNFDPTATGTDTFITLTAKVSRVDGTAVGTISYAWYGDNSNTAISGATSASYNVPANLVWNGTSGYKTFTVQVN